MRALSIWTKVFLALVVFSLGGMALTAQTGLDPGPIKPVASFLTILTGFAALAVCASWWQTVFVVAVGVTAEICGIYTGYPFGEYRYTSNWWPILYLSDGRAFPALVPLAWFLVAGGCALALKPVGKTALFLAPLLATLIDFLMEPVMAQRLKYWTWLEVGPLPGNAPWMNPIGWFLTSFVAAWILLKGPSKANADATWVLVGFIGLLVGIWALG
jgi:uncharacterized membrane protein